jgi:hypothetical protein
MALGAVLSLMTAMAGAAEAPSPTAFRHRLSAEVAAVVEPAVAGATRRLAQPECGRLLGDFQDREGRSLEERLAVLGVGREAYLGLLVFVDGRHSWACQRSDVLAVTNPGGRVVAVCPSFLRAVHQDRGLAEGTLIHEALHTLGLEENPPSSREINRHVFERCGR